MSCVLRVSLDLSGFYVILTSDGAVSLASCLAAALVPGIGSSSPSSSVSNSAPVSPSRSSPGRNSASPPGPSAVASSPPVLFRSPL